MTGVTTFDIPQRIGDETRKVTLVGPVWAIRRFTARLWGKCIQTLLRISVFSVSRGSVGKGSVVGGSVEEEALDDLP